MCWILAMMSSPVLCAGGCLTPIRAYRAAAVQSAGSHCAGRGPILYMLCDLQVGVENYHDWIRLVAELTVNSLNAWQWSGSSVYYLLGLWSRLVSSMPYLKGESPSLLDTFVPKIIRAYIHSRCAWGSSLCTSKGTLRAAVGLVSAFAVCSCLCWTAPGLRYHPA